MDSDLQPGRKLDIVIAEKVMGWRRAEQEVISIRDEDGKAVDVRSVWLAPGNATHLAVEGKIPHYSTDIAAAWQILETIKKDMTPTVYPEGDGWVCEIERRYVDDDEALVMARAETAAHAICLVALWAVG